MKMSSEVPCKWCGTPLDKPKYDSVEPWVEWNGSDYHSSDRCREVLKQQVRDAAAGLFHWREAGSGVPGDRVEAVMAKAERYALSLRRAHEDETAQVIMDVCAALRWHRQRVAGGG